MISDLIIFSPPRLNGKPNFVLTGKEKSLQVSNIPTAMVHTATPYGSFLSASNSANSDGGLWDIFDGNNPPGYFQSSTETMLAPYTILACGFTGEVYGDVDVSAIGGPSTSLDFLWSFTACGIDSNENPITTSVGGFNYVDNVPNCHLDPSGSRVTHTGTAQVNSEGNIKLILSSPYEGQANANAYIRNFNLQLTLASSSSLDIAAGSSTHAAAQTSSLVIESNSQYLSQSSDVTTLSLNNSSSSPPMTESRFSSIPISITRSKSYTEMLYSPSSSNLPAITAPPRSTAASPNSSQLTLILVISLTGLGLLALIILVIWRYRSVWRGWKILERRRPPGHLDPFFVNAGQEGGITASSGSEEEVGNIVAGRIHGWGRNGHPMMDGYGLDIVEKIRRGMPVAYPLPESLDIERGEKAREFAFTDEGRGSGYPSRSVAEVSLDGSNQTHEQYNTTPPGGLGRSISNSPSELRVMSLTPQTLLTRSSQPTVTPPSSLVHRVDVLYGLIQQILTSRVPSDREDATPTQPPPAYDNEETGQA